MGSLKSILVITAAVFLGLGLVIVKGTKNDRLPSSDADALRYEILNNRFHELSQSLREVQEKKHRLEMALPEDVIEQKCNDYKLVKQQVNNITEVISNSKKTWLTMDESKTKQLFASFKNMKKYSDELLSTCHEPVADDKLNDLRAEVLSAGFIFQNLNNPFEISENR